MVDLYAVVRRLTGHELISPKDAQLLTEAVDGLIDQIGSKDTRIAELEAENERLKQEIAAIHTQQEQIEALRASLAEAQRLIRSTHKQAVTHVNCEDEFCAICIGGLFICADCGAAEVEAEERICTV